MCANFDAGRAGEEKATEFLISKNYQIIERNYRACGGEIDIIARHKSTICFIEVKYRRGNNQGHPLESITNSKQKKIIKTALMYAQKNGLKDALLRFDAVGIRRVEGEFKFDLVQNAFDAI